MSLAEVRSFQVVARCGKSRLSMAAAVTMERASQKPNLAVLIKWLIIGATKTRQIWDTALPSLSLMSSNCVFLLEKLKLYVGGRMVKSSFDLEISCFLVYGQRLSRYKQVWTTAVSSMKDDFAGNKGINGFSLSQNFCEECSCTTAPTTEVLADRLFVVFVCCWLVWCFIEEQEAFPRRDLPRTDFLWRQK